MQIEFFRSCLDLHLHHFYWLFKIKKLHWQWKMLNCTTKKETCRTWYNGKLESHLKSNQNTWSKLIGWIVFSIDYLSSLRSTSKHSKGVASLNRSSVLHKCKIIRSLVMKLVFKALLVAQWNLNQNRLILRLTPPKHASLFL